METLNCIASHYSSLINAILTVVLVSVTAWYAFVTRMMWREMSEARLAGIRPLLAISMTPLEKKVTTPPDESLFMGNVSLFNFGRGPAYGLYIEITVPSQYHRERTRTEVRQSGSAETRVLPSEKMNFIYSIFNHGADLAIEHPDFVDLACQFRDAEGNYYSVSQQYSVSLVPLPQPHYRLDPQLEEVRFAPLARVQSRKPIHNEMQVLVSQRKVASK